MKWKFDVWKLPLMFLGGIVGLVLGGIAGTMFANIGYVESVPWLEIFQFFGALCGALIGYKIELE